MLDPGVRGDGQGESGPSEELETRRITEEAARTGRFPDGKGDLRDDSSPIEPEDDAPTDDEVRATLPPR
ncbi:MAG: hypothetical protein ACJ77B_01290 [Chloroflexota bacterium]